MLSIKDGIHNNQKREMTSALMTPESTENRKNEDGKKQLGECIIKHFKYIFLHFFRRR